MVETIRGSDPMGERYKYDSGICSAAKGWVQVDTKQDASYYGTWTNPFTREIFSYCEGDTTLTKCSSDNEYKQELTSLVEWNKERGYWLGIDPGWPDRDLTIAASQRFTDLGFADLLH